MNIRTTARLAAALSGGLLMAALSLLAIRVMAGVPDGRPPGSSGPGSPLRAGRAAIFADSDSPRPSGGRAPGPVRPTFELNGQVSQSDPTAGMAPTELITPAATASIAGFAFRGSEVTFQFSVTPMSADGEGVDSYLLYAPTGWEITAISPAPANNSGCPNGVTEGFSHASGRGIAYWGLDEPFNITVQPPQLPERSGCGPYDPGSPLVLEATLRVGPDAATCPGSPWVGIPRDSAGFTSEPVLSDSMPTYLRGDGGGTSATPASDWKISWPSPCHPPAITLDKVVTTNPQDCSTGGGDVTLDVIAGTTVYYCYLLLNNSQLVTVSQHTIQDDRLGTIMADQAILLPALNGTYTFTSEIAQGAPGTCLDNTALWTAVTASGYGQQPVNDPQAPFLDTQYSAQAQATATLCIRSPETEARLPVIFRNFPGVTNQP